MEIQFRESSCACLRSPVCRTLDQEQTQELRLPDSMPDVGRVLGIWGQCLIRSKQWRSGSIGAAGGVTVWVLYAPEDGGEPRSLESWMPFQLRWEKPETPQEGQIILDCRLAGLDARLLSPRKLMLRAQLSALGEAWVPEKVPLYTPTDLPEDVELLEKTRSVTLAREAGEKSFEVDEELTLPSELSQGEKLLYLRFLPRVREVRIQDNKLVFRGELLGHGGIRCADGQLRVWEPELPFAQYVPLENNYGPEARGEAILEITELEPDWKDQGQVRLRLGLVGQYLVYDTLQLKTVADAYSPRRPVEQQVTVVSLPAVGQEQEQLLTGENPWPRESGSFLDPGFLLSQGKLCREGDRWTGELWGSFSVLSEEPEGLKWTVSPWEASVPVSGDREWEPRFRCAPEGLARVEEGMLRCPIRTLSVARWEERIPTVSGLTLGQLQPPDRDRPSLLICRAGDRSLWELAKAAGATREAIEKANALEGEPSQDRMLLIPVS